MDYKKISDEKAVKTSIRVDIVDILLNSITAFLTGSVVMLAETLQGVSDLIVDGLTYIGWKPRNKIIKITGYLYGKRNFNQRIG